MNIALILAGGAGTRMGTDVPKQLLLLKDKPIIIHTINAFNSHPLIDEIFVVCGKSIIGQMTKILFHDNKLEKLQPLIEGGETRKQSSQNGVTSIAKNHNPDDIVLIHDAARPFVSKRIITDNINSASMYGCCTTAISITDTILVAPDKQNISTTANRDIHFLAQTPQSFKIEKLISTYNSSNDYATDDTSLMIELGHTVPLVLGDKFNIKITTADDLKLAQFIMQ